LPTLVAGSRTRRTFSISPHSSNALQTYQEMTSNLSALFNNAKKVTLVSVPVKEESENETAQQEIIETPKKKIKLEREYEDPSIVNAQTVFVGNVPSGCTQKELKQLFSEFGRIETVRLRNLIPLNPKRGKRLAFIKKRTSSLTKNHHCFYSIR